MSFSVVSAGGVYTTETVNGQLEAVPSELLAFTVIWLISEMSVTSLLFITTAEAGETSILDGMTPSPLLSSP